jgi:hypothetical protein
MYRRGQGRVEKKSVNNGKEGKENEKKAWISEKVNGKGRYTKD